MAEMRFHGAVDARGALKPDLPEAWASELALLTGKRITLTLKRERETRTIEQNKYLWGHVYSEAVAESTGLVELATGVQVFQSMRDVHGFAKLHLLRKPVMTNCGEIDLLGTTTTLTPQEFHEYTERLCAKLAQYGVYIPAR